MPEPFTAWCLALAAAALFAALLLALWVTDRGRKHWLRVGRAALTDVNLTAGTLERLRRSLTAARMERDAARMERDDWKRAAGQYLADRGAALADRDEWRRRALAAESRPPGPFADGPIGVSSV